MTQPLSPEFYEDFHDLSWIDRHFHLDLFCVSSTIHLLCPQILTPALRAPPIEKANLSQKHSLAVVSQSCGLHLNQTPSVRCQLLTCGCCFWIFHCGTCSETLSDALSLVIVRLVEESWWNPWECNLLKRTESSGIVPTKSGVMKDSAEVKHESTVWLFSEMPWPSLISWSALTLSRVRCDLHKQSRLTFFKSQSEIHDGIGRSSRSPVWKHRVAFSRFTLDRHRGQHSAYQLLSSTLTFTDVLIGIDLVRSKMWPSETITFWLSPKSIENWTESGGTYQRNQAFRLTTACGFFEMPWPTQMSIRTHRVIHSIDVIWCLIGTDFVRGKKCLSNLQLIPFAPLFFDSLLGFSASSTCRKNMFCHSCILFVKCSSDTREDACKLHDRLVQFLHWHGILFLLSKDLPSFSSDDFPFPSGVAFDFGASEDVRSFCLRSSLPLPEALTPWWKPHESPLEHCPVGCHCQQSPTFLSTLALLSFRLRVTTPPMNHIVSGFKVPTSHLLVKKQSHWCFKSWITCLFFVSHRFWIIQSQHSL